jgi:hypothetical protein
MVEQQVRDLFSRTVTDDVLGVSTVDLDGVVRRERRVAWQRRGAGAAVLAVVAMVAVLIGPSLFSGRTRNGPGPAATPPAPTLPASWHDRAVLAGVALTEYFPGVVPAPPDESFRWDGRVRADAGTWNQNVAVWAAAARYQGPTGPDVNQCGGVSDCRSFPQADGTVAWLMRMEENGAVVHQVILVRHDGTEVQVGVVYLGDMVNSPSPEETLLRAVNDYRFAAMPPGAD